MFGGSVHRFVDVVLHGFKKFEGGFGLEIFDSKVIEGFDLFLDLVSVLVGIETEVNALPDETMVPNE